jgi:hypothetical protein
MKKGVFVLALLLAAAPLIAAQPATREFKTLVWNNSHVVSYEKRGDRLVISMEMIADFQEDRTSLDWQERDFTSIRIDANNNGELDRDLDIAFGQASGTDFICPQFLRDDWASSGCGVLSSKGSIKIGFDASPFQETAHPIFQYSLPLEELSRHSDTVGLVFKFHSGSTPYVFYPSGASLRNSFKKTISLDLNKL